MKKYNLSEIMRKAWEIFRKGTEIFADCLRKAWAIAKGAAEKMRNVTIETFVAFNARRYGKPWVCRMTEDGKFDFDHEVGGYSADAYKGEAGDLVVFEPVVGAVYGFGQKDHNCNKNTWKAFAKWDGSQFVACDKFGR